MSKIIGVREMVHGSVSIGQAPMFVQRAQRINLLNGYERAGTLEREYSPYDRVGLSGAEDLYDLNAPGRVMEIKKVLRALRQRWSIDHGPISEEFWRHMRIKPQSQDAWDGATADEYVAAIGRYRNEYGGFWPQWEDSDVFFKLPEPYWGVGLAGGPQPSVPGLEMLWSAAKDLLYDGPYMQQYGAWRDVGWFSSYPEGSVKLCERHGPTDVIYGWIDPDTESPVAKEMPFLVCCGPESLEVVDEQLLRHWKLLADASTSDKDEKERGKLSDEVARLRYLHNRIAVLLSGGSDPVSPADTPECQQDSDCLDGLTCYHGMCSSIQCYDDLECSEDRYCDPYTSKCLLDGHECEIDADCDGDTLCESGICVPAPKPGETVKSKATSLVGWLALAGLAAGVGYLIYQEKQ